MALNIASLNVRGLRDSNKCAHLLAELSNLWVNVAAVQETHFTCEADCQVLEDDSSFQYSAAASVLGGLCLLDTASMRLSILSFTGDRSRLIVADVAVKNCSYPKLKVMCPILLWRDVPSFSSWGRSWMFQSGQF